MSHTVTPSFFSDSSLLITAFGNLSTNVARTFSGSFISLTVVSGPRLALFGLFPFCPFAPAIPHEHRNTQHQPNAISHSRTPLEGLESSP